jgi:DNA topoisomerase-1
VTGRDALGRKQYLYHPKYRAFRERDKFSRMVTFGRALPKIRSRVARDSAKSGLPREKVLAALVRLLDMTRIRIGNEEYVKQNGSFGLTTMRDKHIRVRGGTLNFDFRAKSGKQWSMAVDHPQLARIVKRCRDLPGYELFQYIDESGERVSVDSTMVNDYIREITGEDFTAKDFRTWHGTVRAAAHLSGCEDAASETAIKRNVVAALKLVAGELGNQASTCRKHYVHPMVVEAYTMGTLNQDLVVTTKRTQQRGLDANERCVLNFLTRLASKKQARQEARANAA